MGAFYVKKLIERCVSAIYELIVREIITCDSLTNTTEDAKPLYLEFAHDITILFAMSAMELNKSVFTRGGEDVIDSHLYRDDVPLSPDHPPAHRKFRTSDQTPFAAEMVWEKFTCKDSYVDFFLNHRVGADDE